MAGTPLTSLPPEIIRNICAMFCFHCAPPIYLRTNGYPYQEYLPLRWTSLNWLSQTCRLLRDIAQPILYHHIQQCDCVRLLRTLIARPDLAAAVRSVSNEYNSWRGPLVADDIPWIEAAAERVGINLPPGWNVVDPHEHDDVIDRLVDLVLAHVPLKAGDLTTPSHNIAVDD